MGFYQQKETVIICDNCGEEDVEGGLTKKVVIQIYRGYGWKIGKRVICSNCVKKTNKSKEVSHD